MQGHVSKFLLLAFAGLVGIQLAELWKKMTPYLLARWEMRAF